jgi:hypothetical protein
VVLKTNGGLVGFRVVGDFTFVKAQRGLWCMTCALVVIEED